MRRTRARTQSEPLSVAAPAADPVVWPIPQQIVLTGQQLSLRDAMVVLPPQAGPGEVALARLLTDMMMDDHSLVVPIAQGRPQAGKIPIEIGVAGRAGVPTPPDLPGQEGYLLRVSAEGVSAVGRDHRGAQYAIATMLQLIERRDREVVVRGAEVRDWPYKEVRMVHLFLPGTENLAYARRYLRDVLLRYKFNGLFLEIAGGVRFPQRPEIALGARRFAEELRAVGDTSPIYGENVPLGPSGRYSDSSHFRLADGRYLEPDDLTHLCQWARDLHLDVVPEVLSLSHTYYLAAVYREIAEIADADFPDAYCPSNPRSYEILFDVLSSVIALTGCTSVHIGHDEWRAGGLCPACASRDTGELFAEDVLKIVSWLKERQQGVWMWADHLLAAHDAPGMDKREDPIWYQFPQTRRAAELLRGEAPHITLLNWSHAYGPEAADHRLADLGFAQIYGNFAPDFRDWPTRSSHPSVRGAEISSWVAWDDFELGSIRHFPRAVRGSNLLWSNHWPNAEQAKRVTARELPKIRDRLRRGWQKPRLWSEAVGCHRMHPLDISGAFNAPSVTEQWDLTGMQGGRQVQHGVPLTLADPGQDGARVGVLVERLHVPADRYPHQSAPMTVEERYAALVFWQVAVVGEGRPKGAGECSSYPREWSQLLGWYEVLYEDGLTRAAEIRFGDNVRDWRDGWGPLYLAREAQVGRRPDGGPLVVWGLEWTNPRPAVRIMSVTLKGAGVTPYTRALRDCFDTRPMLLGITGVESPKWIDYRPERAGKLPGLDLPVPW